jgi:hypothetical protein
MREGPRHGNAIVLVLVLVLVGIVVVGIVVVGIVVSARALGSETWPLHGGADRRRLGDIGLRVDEADLRRATKTGTVSLVAAHVVLTPSPSGTRPAPRCARMARFEERGGWGPRVDTQ